MTHGDSVGQEIIMEKGKIIRRVQGRVSEKTGGNAFGILSICGKKKALAPGSAEWWEPVRAGLPLQGSPPHVVVP